MMLDATILSWVTFIYLGTAVLYLVGSIMGKPLWGRVATGTGLAGLSAQSVALVLRWIESYRLGIGHAPLSNFYESLVFFSWTVMLIYLILEFRLKNKALGMFVVPIAFLSLAYASLSPDLSSRIQPLVPALQSNWLLSHVLTCFLGYAFFAVAFCLGLIHLWKEKDGDTAKQHRFLGGINIDDLDELIYQNTFLGLVIFSVGIITGAVWAQRAWGSYWSWDPKETWSLITWLFYAALIHSRYIRGWRGRRLALMTVIGFAAVLFTYFGVNYLAGLHSYLK